MPVGMNPVDWSFKIARDGLFLSAFVVLLCSCQSANIPASKIAPAGTAPKSWKDRREQNVVMQKRDFSCGAASLATLMKFYFEDTTATEEALLMEIFEKMKPEDITDRQHTGLSLLDLRDGARRRGYTADGLKLDAKDLELLTGPVLVHTTHDGMPHFVILRGVRGEKVYIADPSYGNMAITLSEFKKEWSGYTLCVDKENFTAKPNNPLAIDANESTSAESLKRAGK